MDIEQELESRNLDNHFRFGGNETQANFAIENVDIDDDNNPDNDVDKLPDGFHIVEGVPIELWKLSNLIWKSKKQKQHVEMPAL